VIHSCIVLIQSGRPLALCAALIALASHNTFADEKQAIDFSHEVVPILRRHCVDCHAGQQAKGGLSINGREELIDSGTVVVGEALASELVSRLVAEDADIRMPPPDRPQVSSKESLILRRWIDEGLVWERGFRFDADRYQPLVKLKSVSVSHQTESAINPIDEILGRENHIAENAVSDELFYRRVSLDLLGLLPQVDQSREFVADQRSQKRQILIDQLLTQSIDYADHWMSFFNDLFRNDYSGTGFITGGRRQITNWLYDSLRENKPYDAMARELIAPSGDETSGFAEGIRWRGEVSAGQTVEIQFAQSVAQAFLGINLKCASCHDSFIDRWKLEDAYGLAAIYSARPLDLYRCDQPLGRVSSPAWLFPEIGQVDPDASRKDRLLQLSVLVTSPDNGSFSRAIVNRIWYRLMGRGIVHPVDAMQSEPWSEDLLDFLAQFLIDNDYNLKSLLRLIVNSRAYQSESVQGNGRPDDTFRFEGPMTKRLTAEQFLDAVWQITGAGPEQYDATVSRDKFDETSGDLPRLQADWIWGSSAAEDSVPPAGERIAFRKIFNFETVPHKAGAVVTCDNSFQLFVNGSYLGTGDNWLSPEGFIFTDMLTSGENEIIVVGNNAGDSPNPAGLFFEAQFTMPAGNTLSIFSDASWNYSGDVSVNQKDLHGDSTAEWQSVTVLKPLNVWEQAVESLAPSVLHRVVLGKRLMARAALMKNDPLMKSLGRPMREQIVTMRPTDFTALEAMDLSNGDAFSETLRNGSLKLLRDTSRPIPDLVVYLYEFAYSRKPTPEELEITLQYLGAKPNENQLSDLLWSIFMSPEFLLVR